MFVNQVDDQKISKEFKSESSFFLFWALQLIKSFRKVMVIKISHFILGGRLPYFVMVFPIISRLLTILTLTK